MSRVSSLPRLAAVSAALALLVGCGGPTPVPLTGKLVLPAGVKLSETDSVTVVFQPEDEAGKSENANVSAKDLTFTSKVVPGKYKVGVNISVYPGSAGARKDEVAKNKELNQVFGTFSVTSTPLRCEVTKEPNQTLTIDLAKKTVGK